MDEKNKEIISKIFSEKVFFTIENKKGIILKLIDFKNLESELKQVRNVYLEDRMCRHLLEKENRCRNFKDNCKKCILDYWTKKKETQKQKERRK